MKKNTFSTKLIIIWMIIAFPLSSHGQFLSELTYVTIFPDTNVFIYLIRNVKPNISVGCTYASGGFKLLKIDHTNFSLGSTAAMPTSAVALSSFFWRIEDLRVCDDDIFFCGRSKNGLGFIGYLNINDYSNSYITVSYKEIRNTTNLFHLTAYKNSYGQTNVVAVGAIDTNNLNYKIVEVKDILGTDTTSIRDVSNEALFEVFYTNNQVVTIGYARAYNALCIRLANPDDVTDPLFNTRHLFSSVDDHILSTTRSAVLGDELAVSFLDYDNNLSEFVTRIRFFDLTTMTMVNAQQLQLKEKTAPYELTYIPDSGKLVVLEEFEFPFGHGVSQGNFITLDPIQNNLYLGKVRYHRGVRFESLDNFNDKYFISAGNGAIYLQNDSAPATSICPTTDRIKIYPVPTYDEFININVNPWNPLPNTFIPDPLPKRFFNNSHNCHHQ